MSVGQVSEEISVSCEGLLTEVTLCLDVALVFVIVHGVGVVQQAEHDLVDSAVMRGQLRQGLLLKVAAIPRTFHRRVRI